MQRVAVISILCSCDFYGFSGYHSEKETPVPIPNTEVKGLSGNGTEGQTSGE